MNRWWRLAVTGGLGFAYAVLLVAAVTPAAPLFLAAAVIAVVTELVLSRRGPYVLPEILRSQLGTRFRVLSLDVLTAVLAARLLPDRGDIVALTIVAVLLSTGARDAAGIFARRVNWRRAGGPVSWRNLSVPGLPEPRPFVPAREPDIPLTLLALLIPAGYAVGELTDRYTAAIVAQVVVIVVTLLFVAGRGVQYRVLNRRSHDEVREAVRAAIDRAAPEVVVHHSGRRGTVEQVLLWVPALAALDRSCLIVVREQTHLDALDGCGIPVVWAPRSQDVELFMVGTVDLALYPSSTTNINNHLLRVPGIYDVLVGHGDSDEEESRSPIARMYDEVWVAGPAGRERYAYPASGVRADRVREIGPVRPVRAATSGAGRAPADLVRPARARGAESVHVAVPNGRAGEQRASATRGVGPGLVHDGGPALTGAAGDRPRPTAVYAPTWENAVTAGDVSSLLSHGEQVVEALLARRDVRLVFVPSDSTGVRVPAYALARDRLAKRIAAEGDGHEVLPAARLPEVLAGAAFAVVDVAPALAEAVRADVPFAVPAVGGLDEAATIEAFPTVEAGTVLRRYPHDVVAALEDALGADSTAASRLAVGRRIDASGDFPRRFRAAVDEAIATQRRRRAFARPSG